MYTLQMIFFQRNIIGILNISDYPTNKVLNTTSKTSRKLFESLPLRTQIKIKKINYFKKLNFQQNNFQIQIVRNVFFF